MEERRSSRRTRTLRSGKILFNDKRSVVDCTVRNISADGACLQVESVRDIPAEFSLAVEGLEASKACRLIWQSDRRLCVAFVAAAEPPSRDLNF